MKVINFKTKGHYKTDQNYVDGMSFLLEGIRVIKLFIYF